MNSEEVKRLFQQLSELEKQALLQELTGSSKPQLTLVFGGYNYNVINSFALQLNGEPEKIAQQLDKLAPETVQTLMKGISIWLEKQEK